jgi:hypothetical protein
LNKGGRELRAAEEGNSGSPSAAALAHSLSEGANMSDAVMPRDETGDPPAGLGETATFDYAEPAELFTRRNAAAHIAAGTSPANANRARSRSVYRNALAYRRFGSGAEAVRFAIEELPPGGLAATVLVVNGDRHEPPAIRALYESADYPRPARAVKRKA